MGANIREIKGRIKAVKNIQRITKTMQMIATARFQSMQKRAVEARPYSRKVQEVVGQVVGTLEGDVSAIHPLLAAPATPTGKHLVLILTSDRGLCGGYNAKVMRVVETEVREKLGLENVDLEVIGKKGIAYCKFNSIEVSRHIEGLGDAPSYEDVAAIADRYMQAYIAGKYDSVRVVSTQFISMGKQEAAETQLLPMQAPAAAEGPASSYEFSPEPAELLADLLPIVIKATLLQCVNEAVVSEQLARMIAMKAATDAATKMGKSLKTQFNRARQAAITTELSEIIGGAAALE